MTSHDSVFTSKTPHFFKVILEEAIDQDGKLGIPIKFAIEYGHQLSNIVKLEIPSGAIWEVELKKSKGRMWLQKGWPEFAEHYSMQVAFFVVFRYVGNDHFQVVILDKTATEIDYPYNRSEEDEEPIPVELRANVSASNKRKREPDSSCPLPRAPEKTATPSVKTEVFSTFRSTVNPRFMVVMQPSYICNQFRMGVPSHFAKKYFPNGKGDVTLCNSDGKTWPMQYYSNEGNKSLQAHLRGGWKTFAEHNRLAVGDICIFELIEKEPNMLLKVVVNRIDENASKICRPRPPAHGSSTASRTSKQSFSVVMQPSYVHSSNPYLHIPKTFAETYLKANREMVLRIENERNWTVEYKRIGDNGRMFTGKNWRAFVEDNELKVGDECIFKLFKENGNLLDVVIKRKLHSSN